MLEDLANSRYLMSAYAASSDSWESFRRTGQQSSLVEVAAALCGAWSLLSEDDDFFNGLDGAWERAESEWRQSYEGPSLPEDIAQRDFHAYLDVDRLLAQELVVLVQAGMNPRHVVRLVGDLREVLGREIAPPDGIAVSDLRDEVTQLAEELCRAQQRLRTLDFDPYTELPAQRAPHRSWLRHLTTFRKALVATAGAASIVGNGAAAISSFGVLSGLGLASVVGGAQAMSTAVHDIRYRQ
jgi:hypothetical protein